jgi:tetratricopeptide (TPR) repeat protein
LGASFFYHNKGLSLRASYVKLFPAIILCCLGFLVYSNSFQNSFHFDDFPSITDNFAIRHIGNLQDVWNFWPTRFLTYFSVALNYQWGGYGVFGYHVFNFLIHLACGILLWWLTILTLNTPVLRKEKIAGHAGLLAFFAAAIFLLHPIQTQPVNYIIQRATMLAALFYLASLSLYVKARITTEEAGPRAARPYYIWSILAGLMSMFSKETAISLPLVVCLYESCFFKAGKGIDRKYIIPYFIVALIMPLTMALSRSVDFLGMRRVAEGVPGISAGNYFLTQLRVMVTYLRLVALPVNQNLDYYYPASKSFFEMPVILSLLILVFVLLTGIKLSRKYKLVSFGIFWFLITLLPESSVIPIADVIFEHRLYLPMAGFSIFLISGLYFLLKEKGLKSTIAILSVLAIFCSIASYQRNKIWKDEFTLWNDAALKAPLKARPYVNRGQAYQKDGKLDLALADYNKAIALKSTYAEAFNNRGLAYQDSGNFDLALADYNKAIAINPKYAEAYCNRGIAYAKKNNLDLAFADFLKALEVLPNCVEAYINRGTVYAGAGKLDLALADYNKAIAVNPYMAKSYFNRGLVFQNEGKLDLSLSDYNKAIAINPRYAEAYSNRGIAYAKAGNFNLAISDFLKVIEINPKDSGAYYNRGLVYQDIGKLDLALADYNRAIAVNPKYAEAYSNRAGVNFLKREYGKAWDDLHRAEELGLQTDPKFLEVLRKTSGREKLPQKAAYPPLR